MGIFANHHGIIHSKSTSTNASSSEHGLKIRIRWIPKSFIKVARLQRTLNLSLSEYSAKERVISPTFLVLKVPFEVPHDCGTARFKVGMYF